VFRPYTWRVSPPRRRGREVRRVDGRRIIGPIALTRVLVVHGARAAGRRSREVGRVDGPTAPERRAI
jgi:hypothetical protein